jgi:hypothetical protein
VASFRAALLCNYAEVSPQHQLTIVGAGIARMWRPESPAPMLAMLALTIEVPADEFDRVIEVVLTIKQVDPAEVVARLPGGLVAQTEDPSHPAFLQAGEPMAVPLVFDLRTIMLPAYGQYDVAVTLDPGEHIRQSFWVAPTPMPI